MIKKIFFLKFSSLVVEVNNEIHSYKLDENTIHMNVKSGSKVSNLMNYAYRQFEVEFWNENFSFDVLMKELFMN